MSSFLPRATLRRCLLCAVLVAFAPLASATENLGQKAFHALDKDAELLAGSVGQGGAVENDAKMFAQKLPNKPTSLTTPADDDDDKGLVLAIAAIVVLIALGLAFLVGYYVGTVTKNATLSHARTMELRVETSARPALRSRAHEQAYATQPPKAASPVPQHRHASAAVATASFYTKNKDAAVSRLDSFRVRTMNQNN